MLLPYSFRYAWISLDMCAEFVAADVVSRYHRHRPRRGGFRLRVLAQEVGEV